MRKMYQGILSVIIGSAILIGFWVLAHYFLVGGTQEVIIGGAKHTLILTPSPISIPAPIAYLLFFAGIGSIVFGILRLLQVFIMRTKGKK